MRPRTAFSMLGVLIVLAFLPACPVQYEMRNESQKDQRVIAVYARKFPFTKWNRVFSEKTADEEKAKEWMEHRPHFSPLMAYDPDIGGFRPLSTLP